MRSSERTSRKTAGYKKIKKFSKSCNFCSFIILWIFDHDSDLHSYLLFYTYDINEESGSDIDVTGAEGY